MAADLTVSPNPSTLARRSPIYRALAAAGASFTAIGDAAIAARFGDAVELEIDGGRRLGLADLSPLPRTGFKGRAMTEFLSRQGIAIGDASNRACSCGRNSRAARLAPTEVLILGSRDGDDDLCTRLEVAWSADTGMVSPVPRRDGMFWFAVTGSEAPAMFAKLCGVDLRPGRFDNHAVAQTPVAHINAIIIRDDINDVLFYHVLGDVASAGSMWAYITDAMAEFDGRLVGLDALSSLARLAGET
jgi:sarcosine oxidase subunit gamma